MEITKVTAAGIRLDEHGRAVLGDDLLDAIGQHDLSLELAGGTNSSNCSNMGCVNDACNSSSQANSGCVNNGCDGPLNHNCVNQNEVGGG